MGDDLVLKGEFDVAAIAARRAVPRVFLVDDRGELLAWSVQSAGALGPEVHEVVRRYVAEPVGRPDGVELVRVGAEQVTVRILPQHQPATTTFAVIVERFALRDVSRRRA